MRGARGARIAPDLAKFEVDINTLREDENNIRVHGSASIDAIIGSLDMFGQERTIVADQTGRVIAGNGTLRAAKALGWKTIACITWSGSQAEADLFAVTDNRSGEKSEWNKEVLARELQGMAEADIEMALHTGFNQAEIEGLIKLLQGEGGPDVRVGDAPVIRSGFDTPKHERERKSKIQVCVVEFMNDEQQADWSEFLSRLKVIFPERPNLGARLADYVRSLGEDFRS